MSHRWRVCNNCVGDEKVFRVRNVCSLDRLAHTIAGLDATTPGAIHDFRHFLTSLANISGFDTLPVGKKSGVFHHVSHEGFRVATNAEKFDALRLDKILEGRMSADPNPMAEWWFRQKFCNRYERLDIPAGTHDVNGNIQARDLFNVFFRQWRCR